MADGPLTGTERAAAEHLAAALGMTQAQAVGVIALTEQNVLARPAYLAGMLILAMSHELLLLSSRGGGL